MKKIISSFIFCLIFIIQIPNITAKSNILEGSSYGRVTTDGTYIYFDLNSSIYRENADGSNRIAIKRTGNKQYVDIQYNNGSLYLKQYKTTNSPFCFNLKDLSSKKISGQDENFVRRNHNEEIESEWYDSNITDIQKYNGKIYFKYRALGDGYKKFLATIDNKGKRKKILDEEIQSYCIYENYIYYLAYEDDYWSDLNLYRCTLEGKNKETLLKSIASNPSDFRINAVGNWIYLCYSHSGNTVGDLYRAKIGEWNFVKVTESAYDKEQEPDINKIEESYKEITVYLNGEPLNFDQPPIIENDRVLVPMRTIFQALGATVDWNGNTKEITSIKENKTVKMQINNNTMTVNSNEIYLDMAPIIKGSRTLIPVRAVAEAFDCNVSWDSLNRRVDVITNKNNSGGSTNTSRDDDW